MMLRILIAILSVAGLTLLAGGAAAYLGTRQLLIAEMDASLAARAVAAAGVEGGPVGVGPDAEDERFVVRDRLGRTLARPAGAGGAGGPRVVRAEFTRGDAGERMRTVWLEWPDAGRPGAVRTAVYSAPAAPLDRLLGALLVRLGLIGAAGAVATVAIATVVSRRATRPLRATADAIGAVDERSLDRRIDPSALPRELWSVAERFNDLLERLGRAFAGQRQFVGDAAHELRTPVASLRAALEVALRRPRSADHAAAVLQRCLTDVERLAGLVESLLAVARMERPLDGPTADDPDGCDLAAVAGEVIERLRPLADAKSIVLKLDSPPSVQIGRPSQRLFSVLTNLVDNAIAYTPGPGTVKVSLALRPECVELRVSDTGIGIAAENLTRIFDPFYRADPSRSAQGAHLGIGLHLVRGHLQAMEATIEVTSVPGAGTEFTVRWPAILDHGQASGTAPDVNAHLSRSSHPATASVR